MDQPIIRDGGVVFAGGTIVAVGTAKTLRADHPDADVTELGTAVVLPGLVNAHTHLELSSGVAGGSPSSFADWILSLPQRIGRDRSRPPEETFAPATRKGIAECLRFGVTCVGDISQNMDITRPIFRESPLRGVSYGEVLGLAKARHRYQSLLTRAVDTTLQTSRMRIGLTPHAPYTVDLPGYRECIDLARRADMPLATHLAENPDERAFLERHGGEFRRIWETLGEWEDGVETFRTGGPIDFAAAVGLLDNPKTLLAHVNYCDDRELDVLASGRASVVYCPRTHAFFGHPPHRWREMVARGINVAVGTDSCASSPNLNLVDDLRVLRALAPEVPAEQLWQMATTRAAKSIAMENRVGSLTPRKAADFMAFDAATDLPLSEILEGDATPVQVWIAGERI
jgi:cytosine/adenosine deaminase-related metal-dependent hydrolase